MLLLKVRNVDRSGKVAVLLKKQTQGVAPVTGRAHEQTV